MVRKDFEEKWQKRLKELKAYKKKHGDCLVPHRYEQNNIKLGKWVIHQRYGYQKWLKGVHSKITQDRIDQLNEIDFVWEVGGGARRDDTLWKLRLKELVKYIKKHGDCLVPRNYEHNRKLGVWVHNQRKHYKQWLKGERSQLTQERIDQLNEIDFVWEVGSGSSKGDTVWKQHLNELVKYKKEHSDCLVPKRYEHNRKLGEWVQTQRQEYKKWLKGESAFITQERIDHLNEIDFVWEVGKGAQNDDTLWKQQFNKVVKYKKKHGDCLVPQNYKHDKLGKWVSRQRQEYKKWLRGAHASITQERINQLNEIDFVWEVGTANNRRDDMVWKQRLNELKRYKKKHGDCLVPQKYEHNRKLGTWVSNQRKEYKKWLIGEDASITQERIDQLNEIDFVWDARFERKSKESNKSNQESSIPSAGRRNAVASNMPNRPRKRQTSSKERPKKRQRRKQSQDVDRELSPSERKERRRFALRALYNWRNPIQPDEVVSI